MNNPEKEYIAVGFGNDIGKIMPVIQMSGSSGIKKIIRGISGITEFSLYHVDFLNQNTDLILTIPWNDPELQSDITIEYSSENRSGIVHILASGQRIEYQLNLARESEHSKQQKAIVDRDKIRQLEAEKQVRLLWPDELAEELKREVFGQDEALKNISEVISANLRRKNPEAAVIVLFGPTGVGKTETGKTLPSALKKLTGQEYGFQQISMSQFKEPHTLHQWFGAPPSYTGYKDPTIFEPCRGNPYPVFLLAEIEDCTKDIWTGLMECFSNSAVKLADNSPVIDLSHTVFILTSNVPIDMKAYTKASTFQKKEICRDAMTRTCGHPKVAGKIANCFAFQELSGDTITDIVLKFVEQELLDHDMTLGHMDEYLMVQMKDVLKNSCYGARGVKDAVRTALTFTVYERDLNKYAGKMVELSGDIENIIVKIL